MQAWERGGGYYLGELTFSSFKLWYFIFSYQDVGASQLIVDGKIGLKNDSQISHFTKDEIVFENGSKLPADVVIFATGYVRFESIFFSDTGI